MKTRNIITVSVLAVLLALGLSLVAPAYGETILIDFGNDDSWRGVSTPNPDANGNYWNSVWSGAFYADMVDIDGNATTVDFGFSSAGGTDSYNGPAGVCSNPPTPAEIAGTDIDAVALGNLAANEAALDYYTTSTFEIQGLNPAKTYNLTFFGSHKYSIDMTTVYSVYTDNTISNVVASASLDVVAAPDGSPGADLHNRDKIATINGVSPQAFDILYVRFIGSNGHDGYLNCMQIEETLGVKAWNPDPSNGATGVELTTNLTWNNPVDITPDKYVLSFRANDPNWLDTGNTTVVDPVVDLNLDGDPATTETAAPIGLDYNTPYYWKVTTVDDPNEYEGPNWLFTTEAELQVDAGPNIITWLDGGIANIDLNGSIVYPYTLTSILWSVVDKPVTATVDIDDASSAVTSASLDTTGTYVLKLWAEDSSVPLEDEDTMEVQVVADACEAAKANPSGYTPLAHDSTDDCKVNLADFAELAIEWLDDTSLTENLEY